MCMCVYVLGVASVFVKVLFWACVMVDLAHVSPRLNLCGFAQVFSLFLQLASFHFLCVLVGMSDFA